MEVGNIIKFVFWEDPDNKINWVCWVFETLLNNRSVQGHYRLNCIPTPKFICWSLNLQNHRMWLFGKGFLKRYLNWNEVIRVGATRYDWCPCKKKELEHSWTQKEDHVRTQGKDGHLQAKRRGCRRNQFCWHLPLRFLLFKLPSLCYFVMGTWAN